MALPTVLLPDNIRPASFEVKRHEKVLTSAPVIGAHRMQTRIIGEAYHTVRFVYDPMHRDDFGELIPFLNGLRGRHDTFGVIIPNFTKDLTGAHPGNYLTLSNNKTRQVVDAGNANGTELFTGTTVAGSKIFSNGIIIGSTAERICVYFDATGLSSSATACLWTTNDGVTGSIASDSFSVRNGRNVVFLTPTSTGAAHVKIDSATGSLSNTSIKNGMLVSSSTATFAPDLLSSHGSSHIMPLPAALMKVSLNNDVQTIRYGSDSLIRIELDMIERE